LPRERWGKEGDDDNDDDDDDNNKQQPRGGGLCLRAGSRPTPVLG
jgi:hypothetical protein